MAIEFWPCPDCRSLNVPSADRCYSCHTPRPTPEAVAQNGTPLTEVAVTPSSRLRPPVLAIVAAIALGVGTMTGLMVLAITSGLGSPPADGTAAASVAPTPTASPQPSPAGTPRITATPAPTPTPAPAWVPYTGRFAGAWLLTEQLQPDAVAAGVYPAEVLLKVKPVCKTGACNVTASLIDPRTNKILASTTVTPTNEGYRIKLSSSVTDLCRGADGRTVENGARRKTSFVLRPFVTPDGSDRLMAAAGTVRLTPNDRGDRVGCRDGIYEIGVKPEALAKPDLAVVKERLSPIPLPDLVSRPNFTVSIKGVRSIYYPVKGAGARELRDRWAATSSKEEYCGKVEYVWHTGSNRTLSCIKSNVTWRWSYVTDPWTGSCTVAGVRLSWSWSMPIARWAGPSLVPRVLVPWWKAMQRYVRDHEAGHVAIHRKWSALLPGRVVGKSCSAAQSIARKWLSQMNAAQEAYDKLEYARTDWPAYPRGAP